MGGACNSALMAQTHQKLDSLEWRSLSDAYIENGWLHSENASGLVFYKEKTMSEVALYGQLLRGDLRNYFSSSEEMLWGAEAASLCRLSKKVVVEGKVGYRNSSARNIAGSYFIDPTHTPFDLIEYTEDNRGDKELEQYNLHGAVGVDLGKWVALGGSFDYSAANYTKRKDLRHVNSLMDMRLVLGGVLHAGDKMNVGLNYAYRRQNETLQLSIYGTQDKTYSSLLSYGAFFGKQEVFGDVGYTKENENKPLFETYHGGALQVSWQIAKNVQWFNEVGYSTRNGYYGDPSYSTVVYAEHSGNEIYYKGTLNTIHRSDRHNVLIEFNHSVVSTVENIYSYHNEVSGRDYVEYLGQREVGERSHNTLKLTYDGRYNIVQGMPTWVATLATSFNHRSVLASNYPDYRKQKLCWWGVKATGTRNFLKQQNCYSLSVSAIYRGGAGDAYSDGRYGSVSQGSSLTRMRNDLLYQEWEYFTKTQLGVGIDLGYSRHFGKLRASVNLAYQVSHALDTEYLGNAMRHDVSLRLGCQF